MFGYILNIITLNADLKVTEALDYMVQILLNCIVSLRKVGDSDVYITAMDSDGPDYALASIKATLQCVSRQYPRKEFSYENCVKKFEGYCSKPNRKIFYADLVDGDAIAQNFQVLIYYH
jgi:hypothetical protein